MKHDIAQILIQVLFIKNIVKHLGIKMARCNFKKSKLKIGSMVSMDQFKHIFNDEIDANNAGRK